jgi:chloride channel protein, CIC family
MQRTKGGRYAMAVSSQSTIPSTLDLPVAGRFWLAVLLTGVGAGLSGAALTMLLQEVQHWMWPNGATLLDAATNAAPWKHVAVLLGAGLVTGAGQIVLVRLSSGNSIDITEAIWFSAGRLPAVRTLGSAVLSVVVVGMGVSLGREGAPKQAGALAANVLSDKTGLSDEQRRLLVACGAGAGMAAAYGVPLGGALFALEVLRGMLALRLVLPALLASVVATAISWLALPNAPTYLLPAYKDSGLNLFWAAALVGPVAGLVSVAFVRMIAWADRNRPAGWKRLVAPLLVLGLLGLVSIPFPQILGNGKDITQLAFTGEVAPALLLMLLFFKPAATIFCLGSGAPGGLFTPSLALGALLGGVLGHACSLLWPDAQPGIFAVMGAGAVLAATTQGPISAVVLMMELTGRDRSFILPMLVAVIAATLLSRTIEPRSIYDARLTDEQIAARQRLREPPPH